MNSLRTKLTLAFGTLLVLVLISALWLIDRQIQKAYDQQVADTAEDIRTWMKISYKQLGRQLKAPLERVAKEDRDVLHAVRNERPTVRPETDLDLLEYGDTTGTILYSSVNSREGLRSEYRTLEQPTLILWDGRLAIAQTLPIQSGTQQFGFVTGGYLLHTSLETFVPPGRSLMFLKEGERSIRPLQGVTLSAVQQAALLSSDNLELGTKSYRTISLPLSDSLGSIIVAVRRDHLDSQRHQLRITLLILLFFSIIAVYGSGYLVARGMTRPLRRLSEGARQLAEGNLDVHVDASSRDEIGLLTAQFNQMVTDLRTLQAELVRAERIAAWRDMARMVAHEIKNPLFPIQLSVENLRRSFQRRPELFAEIFEECTQTVLEEVTRLRHIVDEFGQFARLPAPEKQPCQLNEVVEQALILYSGLSENVTIRQELDADLPTIEADPQQVGQVCQNLVKNAIEAMPEAGVLTVRTFSVDKNENENKNGKERDGQIRGRDPGKVKQGDRNQRWVCMQFQDTGIGMSEEVQANLFTPYYTTKEKGTGLGMAIVERIIMEHRGQVDIQSELGGGTTITVCLPGG